MGFVSIHHSLCGLLTVLRGEAHLESVYQGCQLAPRAHPCEAIAFENLVARTENVASGPEHHLLETLHTFRRYPYASIYTALTTLQQLLHELNSLTPMSNRGHDRTSRHIPRSSTRGTMEKAPTMRRLKLQAKPSTPLCHRHSGRWICDFGPVLR